MADSSDHHALLAQAAQISGASPEEIRPFLEQADWNLHTALENFFTATAEEQNDSDYDPDTNPDFEAEDAPPAPAPGSSTFQGAGGGRTLGGEGVESRYVPGPPQPIPTTSSSSRQSASKAPQRGGMRTLRDLQSSSDSHGTHGHSHSDDDDDEVDQDLFAGGEKSGLAVQNPRSGEDQVNDIIKRAQRNAPRPDGDEPTTRPTHFSGRGQTLGGDDVESTVIESSGPSSSAPPPRVHRDLHLWRDGFSVDDGPLFRFDDPANAQTLDMINRGRAPLDLLNVQQGQEVDLQVHPHREEDYKPPKKKYVPFAGKGQRLGSPTPAAVQGVAASSSSSIAATVSASASSSSAPAQPQIDESVPTLTLQIRLGDGTSLRSRFNTTQTIDDVYSFVAAASPGSQRSYVLMTTFPSKELTDKAAVLGEMSEFKRGGTVVQKWT